MTGRLLMVEDEEGIRIAIARMLRKKGLSVIEAGDGWAAIDLIRNREEEIDLMLLDYDLGEDNGLNFIQKARGSGFTGPPQAPP